MRAGLRALFLALLKFCSSGYGRRFPAGNWKILENMENGRAVRAVAGSCIIGSLEKRAGVVQWQYRSFPSFGRGFDSHRPLQIHSKEVTLSPRFRKFPP